MADNQETVITKLFSKVISVQVGEKKNSFDVVKALVVRKKGKFHDGKTSEFFRKELLLLTEVNQVFYLHETALFCMICYFICMKLRCSITCTPSIQLGTTAKHQPDHRSYLTYHN